MRSLRQVLRLRVHFYAREHKRTYGVGSIANLTGAGVRPRKRLAPAEL